MAGTFRAIRTFGDPGLKPESALTFNVGMLVKAGGFSASVDYWSFDFEDQIVNEPVAGITNFVFGTGATCIGGLANPLAGRFAFRTAVLTALLPMVSSTTRTARRPTSRAWTSTSSTART